MLRTTPLFVLVVLVGCGTAASEPPPTRSSGDETLSTSNEATRPTDELARDPAWEQVPPDDRRTTGQSDVSVRVDTSEGEVARGQPLCTGTCTVGSLCTNERGWRCECIAQYAEMCGGAWREPGPPVLGYVCAPTDPSTDRGDGCPFGAPSENARCTQGGQACQYRHGDCGNLTIATCNGRRWHVEVFIQPPRP